MGRRQAETWLSTETEWIRLEDGFTIPVGGEPDPEQTMLIGAALFDDPAYIEGYNAECGPIRCTREYDSRKGLPNSILDLDFGRYNYNHRIATAFSFKRDHAMLAAGGYDDQINTFIANWPDGYPGYLLIDNEPDQGKKGLDPATFCAAVEHILGVFGYQPRPEITMGIALMQWTFRPELEPNAGVEWLPDVPELNVDIHLYGRDKHTPANEELAPFMRHINARGWTWGMGETNAAEKDGVPDGKADWFRSTANFCYANGAHYWLPFDVEVGPVSGPVRTSQQVIDALKDIAEKYDSGPQGPGPGGA